jgi:hypothetical protein
MLCLQFKIAFDLDLLLWNLAWSTEENHKNLAKTVVTANIQTGQLKNKSYK